MIKKLWYEFWYRYHKRRYLYTKEYKEKYGFCDCRQFMDKWISKEKMDYYKRRLES